MKLLLLIVALLLPTPVLAREMVELKAGDPVVIRSDRAYLLFRTFRPSGVISVEPVFMRVPRAEELARFAAAKQQAFVKAQPRLIEAREAHLRRKAAAEATGKPFNGVIPPQPSIDNFNFDYRDIENVQSIDNSRALINGRPESTYLVEVIPGEFVLYGASYGATLQILHVCMCLGTVGFSAEAGKITDLGHFIGDMAKETSRIAELKAESGFGPSSDSVMALLVATIRPATRDVSIPDVLRGTAIQPADYHAVGKYFDPRAKAINRLVPVPGVLAYDEGRVIDLKTGKVAQDRY